MTTTVFAGAAKQVRTLASGTITSPELVELYLDRIARFDGELTAWGTAARTISPTRWRERVRSLRVVPGRTAVMSTGRSSP